MKMRKQIAMMLLASTGLTALYTAFLKIWYQHWTSHVKYCAVCQKRYRLSATYCSKDASLLQVSLKALRDIEAQGVNRELAVRIPELQRMNNSHDGEQKYGQLI